ncbi:hypothetical protein VaNZ11_010580 [Volvox africanus]|uniref:Pherophorin domain-containing protein n=1 Tax=Volvox africanus TaxID=51714 RepID=A0ABQ5SAR5_9CHLO|nr:hypothetical protein VaNZ11_010580 [Volvox africanus]
MSQMRIQQSCARNPLFQQDAGDVLRALQHTGVAENPDVITQSMSNAEANGQYAGQSTEYALTPFLDSLRLTQGDPMYRAISAQMDNLHQSKASANSVLDQPGASDQIESTWVCYGRYDSNLHWQKLHLQGLAGRLRSTNNRQSPDSSFTVCRVHLTFTRGSLLHSLYPQVFKQLHEHDQLEIRNLLMALESQKQQLLQLAAENDSVRQQLLTRGTELAAATGAQVPRDEVMVASVAIQAGSSHTDTAASGRQRPLVRKQAGMGLNQPDEPSRDSLDAAAEGGRTGSGPGSQASPVVMQRGSRPAAVSRAVLQPPGIGGVRGSGPPTWRNSGGTVSRHSRRPYFILFLPYMLHPAHHCWRFYAAWQYSWTARRTLWLAVAWVLMFLLAVGLLVGLLVPWDRLGRTKFTLDPEVVAVGPSHVSLVVQLNRAAVVYYALLPEASTAGAKTSGRRLASSTKLNPGAAISGKELDVGGRRFDLGRRSGCWRSSMPCLMVHGASGHRRTLATAGAVQLDDVEGDDVRDITGGSAGPRAKLFPFVVACGVVDVDSKYTNYTLTIRNSVLTLDRGDVYGGSVKPNTSVDECTSSFGMVLNQTTPSEFVGPFYARRCQRCPVLKPGTPYVVLLMGDGGRRTGVAQVRFTTSTASLPPAPMPG